MSITGVGPVSAGSSALEQKLKVDRQALVQDQSKHASAAVIKADQAKIVADQQAMSRAQSNKVDVKV